VGGWTEAAHADYEGNLVPQKLPGAVDMPAIVAVLQKHLPADAVLTNGAGNFASWVHRFYRHHGLAKGFKTQLAPTNGSMGYGVPAGIAASIATGRTAFTIAGDGDFLMNGQELATAMQHGGKSIIVLLNNGMYGTIRMTTRSASTPRKTFERHLRCATGLTSARWRAPMVFIAGSSFL
jgi:acetolactate synthase-1/2/3 large subunit